jgi:IclR family transcriptional regulator, acetate operon repressor
MAQATARRSAGRAPRGGREANGRGLELLRVLFDARRPLGLDAIAAALRTTRGAAHDLLRDLERGAFVARDDDGDWSLPAGGVMTLSPRLIGRVHMRRAARPVIERIADRTGLTVSVTVRTRLHRMRLDTAEGRPPALGLALGETMPLHEGVSGRVIMAHLSPTALNAVLAGAGLDTDAERALRAHLAHVQRRGYLVDVGHMRRDLIALSVPVFGSGGIGGAVSVVGPSARWDQDEMERAAPWVLIECAALSAAMGALPPLE